MLRGLWRDQALQATMADRLQNQMREEQHTSASRQADLLREAARRVISPIESRTWRQSQVKVRQDAVAEHEEVERSCGKR